MSDSDIVAATALCYLSLLNYRNVLKRKSSDTTSRSLRTGTDTSASLHSPNTESSESLSDNKSVERTKSAREPKVPRKPKPVRHVKIAGKKRSSKITPAKIRKSVKKEFVENKTRQKRRCWMKAMRTTTSMEKIFKELTFEDSGEFTSFFRMSRSDFHLLLTKIEPAISKQTSRMRLPIPAKIRLAIVLHYLATGASYRNMQSIFKVSVSSITAVIREVCEAICNTLKDEIKFPATPQEWLTIEEGFRRKFPRCIGALDRKRIKCSTHFKGNAATSTVLTTVIDSDYSFVYAQVDTQDCVLFQKLEEKSLNLPPEYPFPGRNMAVPYVFLGDESLPLQRHVMVPFPGNPNVGTVESTFNYNIANTREVVENVFGVLTDVFQIFRKPIDIEKEKIPLITMTCVLLHNYLMRSESSREIYSPPGMFDTFIDGVFVGGSWRRNTEAGAIRSVSKVTAKLSNSAIEIRSEFAEYFRDLEE